MNIQLKYGLNPNQCAELILDKYHPSLEILNGNPGYINVLDAIYAYQLVVETKQTLKVIAAASFKHTSPAGVAIGNTPLEAYTKARNCDPKSSFGDFIAINTEVDEELALYIKTCISDGIIAPSFTDEALTILSKKKGGNYLIFVGNDNMVNYTEESRTIGNITLKQIPQRVLITKDKLLSSRIRDIPDDLLKDVILSMIVTKYTQSNSVCFVYAGQAIGIGAGQQSRVDCVLLARQKAEIWFLRNSIELSFKEKVKHQLKINATIDYLQNDFSPVERRRWKQLFNTVPKILTQKQRTEIFSKFENIVLSSDGFFPFRDSLDKASLLNVKYVVQPGGSRNDEEIYQAAEEYNMKMIMSNIRLFLH